MSDDHGNFESVASTEGIAMDIDGLASSVVRKQAERDELSRQIEAFLAGGGKINQIGENVLAAPPKKPTSNYGSQPI